MDSRLTTIMNFVPKGSRVADIGTDHGYLAIELIKKNIAKFVIASDKNSKPLAAAQKNIKEAGVENSVDLRLGDGLKALKAGEVDVICIAGMGGALMCDILNTSLEIVATVDKIILQPMNVSERVRQWAVDNHFYIEDEDLAEVDDIIYEIIYLSRTFNELQSTRKANSPLYNKFIKTKINKLQKVVDSMTKSETAKTSDKYTEIENQIIELKAKLNENTNRTDCM
ncbi:MAG: tRNA (adenine(22)-N(1))-methyltransferase TrmK [Selenomonadaceae bacterium]|nr:tRNA (adenine(22)-N(1))-methyltransferase TrmK [Selenomonadaceae bacterium]